MKETIYQKTLRLAGGTTGSARTDRWLLLTAIACALLSFSVVAGEMKSATADAVKPAVESQSSAQSATTEKPSQAEEKAPNPYADWKPPEMKEPAAFSSQKLAPEVVKELKERWGVELLGIRRTAAGMFLDFRFKVLDADKALPLFDHRIKPYIVAERSNIKLPVPQAAKVGSFRPTNRGKNIKADKTYYMLFGNPDRHVKEGEKITVVIGEFKVEHLVVN